VLYELLVNIAGKAPRKFCDVLLFMTFSYGCMTLRLQSERQIPVRYIWLRIDYKRHTTNKKCLTIVTFTSIHIIEVHSLCSSAFRNDKAILDIFADELWVHFYWGIMGAPVNHYFSVHQEQIRMRVIIGASLCGDRASLAISFTF
jgi:hypothetical protein